MDNYKEKYEGLLSRIKTMANAQPSITKAAIESLFPEIAESEDEKIRKIISDILLIDSDEIREILDTNNVLMQDIDAWLEKQGEQKLADNVEPKFHAGEWITNGDYTWRIVEVKSLDYILQSQDGNIVDDTISHVDEQFHSFTIIEDARDGDVLFMDNGSANCIFIYKSSNNGIINKYASYNKFGFEGEHYLVLNDGYVIPATKEQRDQLEKAMTDAGYTFDFEKKELKKIEQEPTKNEELTEFDKAVGVSIGTWNPKTPEQIQAVKSISNKLLKLAKKQINNEQKPAWSEEENETLDRIISNYQYFCKELSLKDGLTEVEKKVINNVDKEDINWLKSLKDRVLPQSHWKPSNKQMERLKGVINSLPHQEVLYSLYQDLKKLREEQL